MYTFSPAAPEDLPAVYALMERRIRWMQARNDHLWDAYREVYPDGYFRALTDEGAWRRMLREGATTTFEGWGKETKWNTSLIHLTMSYAAVFLADVDQKYILHGL